MKLPFIDKLKKKPEPKVFEPFLVDVDRRKCVGCERCISDCPTKVLRRVTLDNCPSITDESKCIHCQHCFTICSTGAITFLGHKSDEAISLQNPFPDPKAMETLIRGRRSCRHFQSTAVLEPEFIQDLTNTAWHAPTGVNAQGLHLSVTGDVASQHKLRERVYDALCSASPAQFDRFENEHVRSMLKAAGNLWKTQQKDILFYAAPHTLVVSVDRQAPCRNEDPTIFLSYFELYAHCHHLGTLWDGMLTLALRHLVPDAKSLLNIPETHEIAGTMLFGHPSVRYYRTAVRGPANMTLLTGENF
ncbi:MAG: nitroreductase family protein [Desulfovibrionaceae bacterium]|nr:nitroreductase family protein [Desulfovibrionaceae bacterium]